LNGSATEVQDRAYLVRSECPCCGAPRSRSELSVASRPPAETLPFDRHSRFMSGYKTQRVFFSYFRCGDCDALYCQTFYAQDRLQVLYGRQEENMAELPLQARQRTQDGYAQLLMKHSRGGGGFLEIGADIGLFAQRCAEIGHFDRFWLYEPNLNVHSELSSRLLGHVHTIHSTMAPTSDLPHESVSTAALIHVLDHLLDPAAFLAGLREKLEKNGVLLVVTHNAASLLARLLGRRWPPFALQHPQLYTPRSITRLFGRVGFAVVEIKHAVNYFPLMHLVRAGLTISGIPNLLPQGQGPIIPIKLGNMAVIARRHERR
jgi:hypothetical protein